MVIVQTQFRLLLFLLCTSLLLSVGCQQPAANPLPTHALPAEVPITPPPTSPVTQEAPPLPTLTPGRGAFLLYAPAGIPAGVLSQVDEVLRSSGGRFAWASNESEADIQLALNSGQPLAVWVYALVAPFPTIEDGTTLAELQAAWQGQSPVPLVLTQGEAAVLEALWGSSASVALTVVSEEEVVDQLWTARPAWSIRPFDKLTPRLKVLRLDGRSPVDPDFEATAYPLRANIGITGDSAALAAFAELWPVTLTNRDPGRITRVAMSGVTALVRATAHQMELNGILWPGEEVAPVLQMADIAHISNEVAFTPECPPPNPIGGTTFCSHERYFALLQELGTDVVEVTGNHVNDWGADTFAYTLDLYEQAGMRYFGGGRDAATAGQPATYEHNGNRIAFVGCNPIGPNYAWAGGASAGSHPCDYATFYDTIATLRDEGYLVITTQQYLEIYSYNATAQQELDFRTLATAGAAAVSGSQAHHAQGFAFEGDAFIHYGLGNLFFDQMDQLGTRQSFVDVYTIYDGRLINVELWTGLIENYARPRTMTPEERAALLQSVFAASGW